MSDKRIVEIEGVKIEVDMRTAKKVDSYKVGDNIKVLVKEYSGYKSHAGVIVGFDDFQKLPTIIIAYVNTSSYETPIKFAYLNSDSKEVEICPSDPEEMPIDKNDVIEMINKKILKAEEEVRDLNSKKNYFLKHFALYFKAHDEHLSVS